MHSGQVMIFTLYYYSTSPATSKGQTERAEAAEAAVEAKKRLKNLLYLLLSKLKSRGWRRKHRHLATKIYTTK